MNIRASLLRQDGCGRSHEGELALLITAVQQFEFQ